MKTGAAKVAFSLLAAAPAAAGALAYTETPAAAALRSPATGGAAIAVGLVGLVACFAPYDRPRSAPSWAACLAGLALGITLGGLCLFTPSFLWLAAPLLLYALALLLLARAIALGAPDEGLQNTLLALDRDAAEALPPQVVRRVRLLLGAFGLAGAGLTWAWAPPAGGAHPAPLQASVAPVVSRPTERLRPSRVVRRTDVVELNGDDLHIQLGLRRARALISLHGQRLIVEPCLHLSSATVDGFFTLGPIDGYSLEPAGLALVDLLEGPHLGWVRAAYPRGRARYGTLAGIAPFLGRRAGPRSIRATMEVGADLASGRVVLDAVTRLLRPADVHEGSLLWIRLLGIPRGVPLTFGVNDGIDVVPQDLPAGRLPAHLQLLTADGKVVRLLRAKDGDQGPYETVQVGPFHDWVVLPGANGPILLVCPDWRRQASHLPSRTAGYGLPENAILCWYEEGGVNLLFDLADTRIGGGYSTAELPAGAYRDRVVLTPLRGRSPAKVARAELDRLADAERFGRRVHDAD